VSGRRALFLDRDGTLIVDVGTPSDPASVELIAGAADALRALQRDWLLVVVSNQSGIGRGIVAPEQATAVHDRFVAAFGELGVAFAAFYYCPHAPEANCACRKPSPGLLLDAAEQLGVDLGASAMIGDKASDVEAGRAAGVCCAMRFGSDGDDTCADWADVVDQLNLARSGPAARGTRPT
jgi:D-glycero-D-manno-heptose 1,7-bisphosphate phosphatase